VFFLRRFFMRSEQLTSAFLGALLLASAVVGCAETPGERLQKNVKQIKHDQRPERLIELGKGFASVGDLTRAEQYFSAAIETGADEREVLPLLLRVCVLDGRFQMAIQYAENHLQHAPTDIATRFVVGSLYSAIGDAGKAQAAYNQVLEVEPDNADAHFALAVLLRDIGEDPVLADHHFREYLRLKPGGTHVEEAQASLLKTVPGNMSGDMSGNPPSVTDPAPTFPTQIPPPNNEPKD
jgi:tetratricopeptide (TPR) repeat protein